MRIKKEKIPNLDKLTKWFNTFCNQKEYEFDTFKYNKVNEKYVEGKTFTKIIYDEDDNGDSAFIFTLLELNENRLD